MDNRNEQVREIIAQEAGDWFVAHRTGALDSSERRAFDAWLTASPVHVEEYLGVAVLANHLAAAADDPQMQLPAILERVRAEEVAGVVPLTTRSSASAANLPPAFRPRYRHWVAAAAAVILSVGAFFWWSDNYALPHRYATRHGETKSWRLSDNSILHLNTDTTLTVRFTRGNRRIELERGEALFEVAHEADRPFLVAAGSAQIVAVGTVFDVYRATDSTRVTVTQGQVSVTAVDGGSAAIRVGAGEQVQVMPGVPLTRAGPADAERSTAWLRRQIVFEEAPLAAVAAEFNRYTAVPIEVETPALRSLAISGTFAADDTDSFIAFLRTLDGVRVEVLSTRIRVSGNIPPR